MYCGSSPGRTTVYAEAARVLAKTLVTRGVHLVYGGASVGIMGVLADRMLEMQGRVIGVMPEDLQKKEIGHPGLTELHVVPSMHERKAMMANLADGFIAMPGGAGTLEEIFEVWTWAQLGYHKKPVGVLNVDGYFDHLLQFLDHAVDERFLRQEHRSWFFAASGADVLLDQFDAFMPATVEKWIR